MFSLLGMLMMVSGNNVLVVYLGLEMMSLSMYALVALRRDRTVSTEAAMKYFVLGALASGFLLYGMSMLYGATGSLELPKIFAAVAQGQSTKGAGLRAGLPVGGPGLQDGCRAVPHVGA